MAGAGKNFHSGFSIFCMPHLVFLRLVGGWVDGLMEEGVCACVGQWVGG